MFFVAHIWRPTVQCLSRIACLVCISDISLHIILLSSLYFHCVTFKNDIDKYKDRYKETVLVINYWSSSTQLTHKSRKLLLVVQIWIDELHHFVLLQSLHLNIILRIYLKFCIRSFLMISLCLHELNNSDLLLSVTASGLTKTCKEG